MAQTWDAKHFSLVGDPLPVVEQVSVDANSALGRFTASANGTLVYRSGADPNLVPTWFDRDGKNLGTVGEPGHYYVLVLSQDGTKAGVGLTDASGKQDLWVLDLMRGTRTRLTSDPGRPTNPLFSADGARVVFESTRTTNMGFYRKASSGAGEEEVLIPSGGSTVLTDWSKDGRYLAYARSGPGTLNDLWIIPMEGDHKPFPFLRTPFNELGARFSPDGRWIAYYSNESGKSAIYVKRFIAEPNGGASTAAGKWIISRNGGVGMIHWRRDGKELYYLGADSKVMAVDVSATGNDFEAGVPRALFSVPEIFVRRSPVPGNLADVTPDGKRFLFALPVEQNHPAEFQVMLNWEAGLKR